MAHRTRRSRIAAGIAPHLSMACAIWASSPAVSIAAESTSSITFDCGVNALYLILELEGRPASLDQLERVLPPRHPDGFSMAELVTASRRLGLPLEGVRFGPGDPALDRPAIAYFNDPDADAGHYAVLRPVGNLGKMIQVIDPPRVPRIVDHERLFTETPWTGRLLLRRAPWFQRLGLPFQLSLAGFGVILAIRRRVCTTRFAQETEPGIPTGMGLSKPGS